MKLISFLERVPGIFRGLFCVYLAGTFLMLVILDKHVSYYPKNILKISNVVLTLLLIILLVGGILLWYRSKKAYASSRKITDRNFYLLIGLFFLFVLITELFISSQIHFYTGWDAGYILENAEHIAVHASSSVDAEYFSEYPNNLVLLYILALLYKLGNLLFGGHPYALILGVVCLTVCFSVFLSVLSLYKITKSRVVTVIGMVVGALLIALSPWIVIPYSDALGMIFPAAAIFFYLYVPNRYLRYFLVSLSCLIGYLIKPTVLIVLIALVMIKAFAVLRKLLEKRVSFKRALGLLLSVMLAIGIAVGAQTAVKAQNIIKLDENRRKTLTHFLMMGLNYENNGVFSDTDVLFSTSFPDVESRQKANLEVVKERLKSLGPVGYLKLMTKKNLANYNDGTFSWGSEGGFYENVPQASGRMAEVLRSFYYSNETGSHYIVFATVEQAIWLFVLLCSVFCMLPRKGGGDGESIVALALLGVSIFLLIFECRARYLYIFSPLFVILMGAGVSKAAGLIVHISEKRGKGRKESDNDIKSNTECIFMEK